MIIKTFIQTGKLPNLRDEQSQYCLFFRFIVLALYLSANTSNAQVKAAIDTTSIKIGEQITYSIQVEQDTTNLTVFPEGQTFMPLEMIDSYPVDTIRNSDKINLIKKYGLTQFDSGAYTIPRQKIIIGDKTFFTDSLAVEIRDIVVDTTQGIYDIKPIIAVEKTATDSWKKIILILFIIAAIGFLLYWFVFRVKPLTEEEKIALLPPYDRAKLALKKLDESNYLETENLKGYYSELTFIIRKYLEEKVYNRALESTTGELISRLNMLKDSNQVDLSTDDIKNLESILERADLVKFAKSAPDIALAKIDRTTIDFEIDQVKQGLPEPTEEEKLLNEKYKKEQELIKKKQKIGYTFGVALFLLLATLLGFSFKYGFAYVKDSIFGHDSKTLLEGEWVSSDYGAPPVTLETPLVLKRTDAKLSEEVAKQVQVTVFNYGALVERFYVSVSTATFKSKEIQIDVKQATEGALKVLENAGASNIVTKDEKFTTPNGAEGLKVYGTLQIKIPGTELLEQGRYTILAFAAEQVSQQIILVWKADDIYADQMVERILNSVELKQTEK